PMLPCRGFGGPVRIPGGTLFRTGAMREKRVQPFAAQEPEREVGKGGQPESAPGPLAHDPPGPSKEAQAGAVDILETAPIDEHLPDPVSAMPVKLLGSALRLIALELLWKDQSGDALR